MYEYEIRQIEQAAKNAGEPSYRFQVGDSVRCGALIDCVVDEVKDGGNWYGIRCKRRERDGLHDTYRWVPWCDIRPIVQPSETVFTDEKAMRLQFFNTTMESMIFRAITAGVDFEPDYQRGLVWTEKDRELLLESIFMRADIGKFVFRVRPTADVVRDGLNYEILDGKQRLVTVRDFYLNRFPYKGIYFNELSNVDRRTFLGTNVSIADLEGCTRNQILQVFIRLNRGGRPVSDEVIQRAKEMLGNENKNENAEM